MRELVRIRPLSCWGLIIVGILVDGGLDLISTTEIGVVVVVVVVVVVRSTTSAKEVVILLLLLREILLLIV